MNSILQIKPFRGVLYNKEKIKDLSKVMAPPYDVISPAEQEFYYEIHSYNVIRLILGKEYPEDNISNNKYLRAGKYFREWLSRGILKKKKNEDIYIYEEEYFIEGEKKKRRGFIALMRLEDFNSGVIFPHENTLFSPREDRFKLLSACEANLSPIFSFYSDSLKEIDEYLKKSNLLIKVSDREGIEHKLKVIEEKEIISKIIQKMRDKKLFIADGHHRYLTALKFRNEAGGKYKGEEDFVMMYFSNMETQDFTILPTHRVIGNLKGNWLIRLNTRIKDFFNLKRANYEEMNRKMRENEEKRTFGLYTAEAKYYLLILKDKFSLLFKKEVDTAILNELIIKEILGRKELKKGKEIDFFQEKEKVINLVDREKYQVAFFLNPLSLNQVKNISLSGEKMPPKTSFFYPKLLSGLVIRDLIR